MQSYREFLESKIVVKQRSALAVGDGELNPSNFPHQNAAIKWAASIGSALLALSFGLGKTRIQCELAKIIHERTGKKFLIICPLGVKYQFQQEDGPVLGMRWRYVTCDKEVADEGRKTEDEGGTPYLITNYERVRDGDITPALHDFGGVSLDEGSVIHSFGSKTTQEFKRLLKGVPYKFVATATPAPNEYREIIYYADFMGIKDTGQILTRWFKRNPDKAGDLQINPNHEKEFWLWVSSWALFLYKPSDLGFSDEGYQLPKLNVHWHRIGVDQTRAFGQVDKYGQHRLLLDAAGGVTEASAETRETIGDRLEEVKRIINPLPASPKSQEQERDLGEGKTHWIIWHHREAERVAIEKALPEAVTVYGAQDIDEREQRIMDFAHGKIRILATKPVIAGSGCNFQYHCHSNIFMGVDYKFKDFIQAIHRTYRFQQGQDVEVHIIYTESQDAVVEALRRKWEQHDELVGRMREIIRTYKLSSNAIAADMNRTIGVTRVENKQKLFTAVNNDCVLEMENIADNSIDLIHTSIPFGNHYEYTEKIEDFGHNPSDGDFWTQMDYLLPEMMRILKPGRVAAIHVKDRVVYRYQTESEFMEISPFSDECVMAFKKHHWMYMGRRTIVTDVVRENNSSYRLGWTEATEGDMSKMGSGLPEYVLLFRKPPSDKSTSRADEPVRKTKQEYTRARWQIDAHAFWMSDGNTPLAPVELYDYQAHVERMAAKDRKSELSSTFMVDAPQSKHSWVWTDVTFMRTLNSEQMRKRQDKHICPLPFDIVERIITMYSNPGETVMDPFAGLFTVPYVAMKLGRKAYGIELNVEYFAAGVKYCEAMQRERMMPTLFDLLEVEGAVQNL
jgi:DNA modification methylase